MIFVSQADIDAEQFRFRPRVIVTLLGLQVSSTVMELASLVLMLPIFQFVQAKADVDALVQAHKSWRFLTQTYEFLGVPLGLETLLVTSFVFLILRQGFAYCRLMFQAWARETLISKARGLGFTRHLYSSVEYQEKEPTGKVVNDLITELHRGVDFVIQNVFSWALVAIILIYVTGLLALSIPMTLTTLIVFGIAVAALRGPMKQSETVGREVLATNRSISGFLVERLQHVRLIRLSGTEAPETSHMEKLLTRQRSNLIWSYKLLARVEVAMEPIVIGASFVLIFLSVKLLNMQLEQLGLFLVMVLRLLPVTKQLVRLRQAMRESRASYDAITVRLDAALKSREPRGGCKAFDSLNRGIFLENVSFAYARDSSVPVLSDVTLEIPAHKLTALVGPSGGGKSTLMDMIPRTRQPTKGRLTFDDSDIKEFDLEELRRGVAYAPQIAQIFNVPLVDHIRYGKAGATMEEVERAAELAGASDFIRSLPDGFDTQAGDGGGELSGGQRQRLDLARALVRRAPILLLDEPTSSLDANSEALFRQALRRIREETDITVVIIGHHLASVMAADQIVVLQDGKIDEVGTHSSLINSDGWYSQAFASQQSLAKTSEKTSPNLRSRN